jgi:hypothetical protein
MSDHKEMVAALAPFKTQLLQTLVSEALNQKYFKLFYNDKKEFLLEQEIKNPDEIKKLLELPEKYFRIESGKPNVLALTNLLDRLYGKPVQQLEHTGKDGVELFVGLTEVDRVKLDALLISSPLQLTN